MPRALISRRFVLTFLVLLGVGAACATYTRVDEPQVRARGAEEIMCDGLLVTLTPQDAPREGVARYAVSGCKRSVVLDCNQAPGPDAGVVCRRTGWRSADGDGDGEVRGDGDDRVAAVAVGSAAGCACARLFASKDSSSSSSSGASTPMSTTPQRNRR